MSDNVKISHTVSNKGFWMILDDLGNLGVSGDSDALNTNLLVKMDQKRFKII